MQAKRAEVTADHLLWSIGIQLRDADHQLQSLRTAIDRTYDNLRSSRETIVRTSLLIQRIERLDSEKK